MALVIAGQGPPARPGAHQIRCMKLTLVINGVQRHSVSLDGGLPPAQISRRISSLLHSAGVSPTSARFVDLLWAAPEGADDAASTLDLESLAHHRLAPLLAAPPGEANLHYAGLVRAGDAPQGTPELPSVTLDVQVPVARLPPRTPVSRSTRAAPPVGSRGRAASGSGRTPSGTPRPMDHSSGGSGGSGGGGDSRDDEAGGIGSCGDASDWDVDDAAGAGGAGRTRQPPCVVVKTFGALFKRHMLNFWVCIDKCEAGGSGTGAGRRAGLCLGGGGWGGGLAFALKGLGRAGARPELTHAPPQPRTRPASLAST